MMKREERKRKERSKMSASSLCCYVSSDSCESASTSAPSPSEADSSNSIMRSAGVSQKSVGIGIDLRGKYGSSLNAAIGRSNTDPSSSANIYAPPLFLDTTINGPRYLARIFLFRDFSIAVFLINTKSPVPKSKSRIVAS